MKIRVEGTLKELSQLINRWAKTGIATDDIEITKKVKSISKFYPNRTQGINCLEKVGRVYLELE